MQQVTAVAPLAYLLALAEEPCVWFGLYVIFRFDIIPAWKRWRAKRMEKEVTETTGEV